MDWKQILRHFINDVNSNKIYSLLESMLIKARSKDSSIELDPDIMTNLANNTGFCDLITKFNFELESFTEQLAVIYCELLDMYGILNRPDGFADPAKGDNSFTPDVVDYFWKNFYNIKDVNVFLDSLKGPLYIKYQKYKKTVTKASLTESIGKIHSLFLDVLNHSNEVEKLIESAFTNDPINIYKHKNPKEYRSLMTFSGEELNFYTFWKTHRFMDIDQALDLLINPKGLLKKRVKKKDLPACHYFLLSMMSVIGFLTQVCYLKSLSLSRIDGSLIDDSVKKIKKEYDGQMMVNGIHLS